MSMALLRSQKHLVVFQRLAQMVLSDWGVSRKAAEVLRSLLSAATQVSRDGFRQPDGHAPERILAVCLSHLGDLVLLTPLFANLRLAYPDAQIAALCKNAVADIPRNHPVIDEVITYEARWILGPASQRAGLLDTVKLIRELRARSYDLLVVCYDHPMDRILGLCTGIPVQVSLEGGEAQQLKSPADGAQVRHRVEHAFDLLRALGVPIVDSAPSIALPAADVAWVDEWLREQGLGGETILGVHPGAGGPQKRWPAERFARVAENLANRYACKVVVTGGPVDAEAVQDFMRNMGREAVQAPTNLTVGRLCALIQRFTILLCNDCGPMHIAAALRVPVIAVFGPSSPRLWGPYPPDPRHVVVAARDARVESVTSEEVLAAINCSPLPVWLGEKSTATIKCN
jgi:ADP-heptose:LPS heptosyltransferase